LNDYLKRNKMSKIYIVPDVHGRTFWHKAREIIDTMDKVVFLGDYLDPYGYEGITKENAIEEFKEIIQFKVDNPNKVILLLGNHDCAYYYNFGSASRYDYDNEEQIKTLFRTYNDKFQLWYKEEKYLFTHAGITNEWLYSCFNNCNIDQFLEKSEEEIIPYLWEVGMLRGGWAHSGSIVWHDVREGDLEPTYFQIFGHTQLEKPIIKDNYACLDVRECFLLDTKTGKITNAG